jgi:gamma-glutamyltranspeptidase
MTGILETARGADGMVTAPYGPAAEAGRAVLAEGGNAIEAMIAAAAAIAVVYPHMNGIGGDGFWLIHLPGRDAPIAIQACGPAGAKATPERYAAAGLEHVPARGPLAANTVPGAVAGWGEALALAAECGGRMKLAQLLDPAIAFAAGGVPTSGSHADTAAACADELAGLPGFAGLHLPGGRPPGRDEIFRQPALADSLRAIAAEGTETFYRGALARRIAGEMEGAGCPVTRDDLAAFRARHVAPLSLRLGIGTIHNLPPPTQGMAALMILGIFERLGVAEADGFPFIHGLIESTKLAYAVRDAIVADPETMTENPAAYLTEAALDRRAAMVDRRRAAAWHRDVAKGDTIWMGAADNAGIVVSYIQSLYWEFGSGMVLPETGITLQNRGSSFSLDPDALNGIAPGRLPFHTLNPALARLDDGRVLAYGCMGGEAQPQIQASIFARHAMFGMDLQDAITAPRWIVGRTWGAETGMLAIESRFPPAVLRALSDAGHRVQPVGLFSPMLGHAGAVSRHASGLMEGATDPRSDGAALGV